MPTPTTAKPGKAATEVAKALGKLIEKVEPAALPADVKEPLLTRLRTMRDAALSGTLPSDREVQALIAEALAALTRPKSSGPGSTSSTAPRAPESTTAVTTPSIDGAKVVAQLDDWAARIAASNLSATDKATLQAAVERLRSAVTAGTLRSSDLALVAAIVKQALESRGGGHSTSTTVASPDASTTTVQPGSSTVPSDDPAAGSTPAALDDSGPRPKGRGAVAAAIETVTNSPLPEAVKQELLGVLTQAQAALDDPTLSPEQVAVKLRELHEAEKAKRLAAAVTKLARFSEKIATLAFSVGSLPDAGPVITEVHAKLLEANTILAGAPTDVATVKAAWMLLHDARTLLQQFMEASG